MTENETPNNNAPIYGIHPVEELLAARMRDVEHVYFDRDRKSAALFELLRLCRRHRLSYNLVPEAKLNSLAATSKHQGVVAFCGFRPYNGVEDLEAVMAAKPAPLFVVAASIEDPGNLGAIIRSCVCLGADALLLERKNTVPLNAAAAKSSAGMIERLCIVKPRNLEGLIGDLAEKKGFSVVGAGVGVGKNKGNGVITDENSMVSSDKLYDNSGINPDKSYDNGGINSDKSYYNSGISPYKSYRNNISPDRFDFTKPTILVVGGENRGIPPYLQRLCKQTVSIPMSPQGQSLNASVAAGVLIYECMRQRGFRGSSA